jgi:hypothetical protein
VPHAGSRYHFKVRNANIDTAPAIAIRALEPTDQRLMGGAGICGLAGRALYDSLASFDSFIRYQHPL